MDTVHPDSSVTSLRGREGWETKQVGWGGVEYDTYINNCVIENTPRPGFTLCPMSIV